MARHRQLSQVLILSSLTGTATLTFAWLVQPYFHAAGLPLALYGVMWTLLNVSVGATGLFAYKLERIWTPKTSMVMMVALVSGGYFLAGAFVSLQAIGVLFFFSAVRGIATPILKDLINRDCDSEIRATILSLRNFIIRINFAVIGPLLGWVVDHHSLNTAYWVAGTIYLIAGGACLCLPRLGKKAIRPQLENP